MRRSTGIKIALALMGVLIIAGIVIAQEKMGKAEQEEDVRVPMGPGGRMWRGGGAGPVMHRGDMGDFTVPMQGRRGRPGGGPDQAQMLMRLADKLELSEEQRDAIKHVFTEHQKDMIKMKSERELAEVEMRELLTEENPNLGVIENHIREIANLEARMRFSQIKTLVDAKSVLTDEQKEKLKETPKDRPARMMQMRQGRRGGFGRGRR